MPRERAAARNGATCRANRMVPGLLEVNGMRSHSILTSIALLFLATHADADRRRPGDRSEPPPPEVLASMSPDDVKQLLDGLPAKLATMQELVDKIVALDQGIPKEWSEAEDEATSARRAERRELLAKLREIVEAEKTAFRAAQQSTKSDSPLYHDTFSKSQRLNKYGNFVGSYNHALSEEDRLKAKAAQQAAPVLDGSIKARIRTGDTRGPAMFMTADRTHFVFPLMTVQKDRGKYDLVRPIAKGEPLLVVNQSGASNEYIAVTIDGIAVRYYDFDLTHIPLKSSGKHPLKPEQLEIEDAQGWLGGPQYFAPDSTGFALESAEFLRALGADDPRRERFINARDKVLTCYTATLEKLDPEHRRGKYDVVTYRGGMKTKVESLTANLDRKACGKCGCKAFNDKKRALAREVLAPLQKAKYAELAPIITRVESLFKQGK